MNNTIRIGILPYSVAVERCLTVNSNSDGCLKRPGINIEVLTTLLKLLNIQFGYVVSETPGCGRVIQHNGTIESVTGLVGMLHRGEVDIIGNLCSFDEERHELFHDIGLPLMEQRKVFVRRAIPHQIIVHLNILHPFSKRVWVLCLCVFLSAIGLLYVYYWKSDSCPMVRIPNVVNKRVSTLSEITLNCNWLFAVGTITILYTSQIQSIYVEKVVQKGNPVHSLEKMADELTAGAYKFFSHKKNYRIDGGNTYNGKLVEALTKHGHKYFSSKNTTLFHNALLNEDPSHPPYIFRAAYYWFRISTFNYRYRNMLDVTLEDHSSGEWLTYLWASNFRYKNELLYFLGSLKNLETSVQKRYVPPLRKLYTQSEPNSLSLHMIWRFMVLHIINLGASVFVFLIEYSCSCTGWPEKIHPEVENQNVNCQNITPYYCLTYK